MCLRHGGWGGLPDPGGNVFAALEAGDEVLIKTGAGKPAQEADTTDIIVEVSGMSALTAGGIKLMCTDGFNIEPTGQHIEPGDFDVSPEAQTILDRAHA